MLTQVSIHGSDSPAPVEVASDVNMAPVEVTSDVKTAPVEVASDVNTFCLLLQISTNPVLTQVSVHGSDSPVPVEVASDVNTDEEGVELGGIDLSHHNYCELPEIKEEESLLITDNNNEHQQQTDENQVRMHIVHRGESRISRTGRERLYQGWGGRGGGGECQPIRDL